MGAWVTHLVSTFGSAASGGVRYYQLDNEPDNWQFLRADIYAAFYPPGTWCEPFYTTNTSIGTSLNQDFINRTMAYATAIKAADPTASVLFMSTENAQDLVALPNVECGNPAGPYSVTNSLTMAISEARRRPGGRDARPAARLRRHALPLPRQGPGGHRRPSGTRRAPRSFRTSRAGSTRPIPGPASASASTPSPRTAATAARRTPRTGTQEADVLGMYGRLGYQVASYWTTLVHGSTHLPIYNAMAMYRSYDGNGARFGAFSIGAASPNAGVNVYAASDSPTAPTKVWVMLVNVSGAAQSGLSITLKNFTPTGSAQVYRMVGGGAPAPDTAVALTNGSLTGFSLAANSVALLVMSK